MRIISGRYKGRRLNLPTNYKARPTTDFAKENLFNILANRIDWDGVEALDLFGGTGSVSLELVSRGCSSVICVEKYTPNYVFIKKIKEQLEVNELDVIKADVFRYITTSPRKFDFIFADPPYNLPNLDEVPVEILKNNLLKEDAILVVEHSKKNDFSHLPQFEEKRVYGSVNFSIFTNRVEDTTQ